MGSSRDEKSTCSKARSVVDIEAVSKSGTRVFETIEAKTRGGPTLVQFKGSSCAGGRPSPFLGMMAGDEVVVVRNGASESKVGKGMVVLLQIGRLCSVRNIMLYARLAHIFRDSTFYVLSNNNY